APLTGEDVRAWNERLWAERKAQKAQEEAALLQARAAGPDLVEQNRRLGEALAHEVAERERARISWWSGSGSQDATPIGFRLLSLLPTTQSRIAAGALA